MPRMNSQEICNLNCFYFLVLLTETFKAIILSETFIFKYQLKNLFNTNEITNLNLKN